MVNRSEMPPSNSDLPPPFELRQLARPVFASLAPPPPPDAQPTAGSSGGSKNPVVRSVDGYNSFLWIGSNDGRVKGLEIKASQPERHAIHSRAPSEAKLSDDHGNSSSSPPSSTIQQSRKPTSFKSPDRLTSKEPTIEPSCFQDCHIFAASENPRPKAVEKLILVPMIALAIILSEGTVTFHSIADLEPCPSSLFPSIRGVSSVTLDEDIYNSGKSRNSGQSSEAIMCVIKKKHIYLYSLHENGAQQIHDVAFASAAFQSLLRGSALLLSDIEQYYLVALDDQPAQVIPLLPISQTSPPAPENEAPSSQTTRHRPSMSAIPNSNEFLLASHTGSTCLGIFVSSSGEPSRGTLEWPSNPRSVSVDINHVLALLFNGTVEIHLLATQELVQVIKLPTGLDPRTLAPAKFGLSIPGDSYTSQLDVVTVPLVTQTPHSPKVSPSIRSLSRPIWGSAATHSRILLVGRDSLHALATRTLLAEVESLIGQNRWDDAYRIADQSTNPRSAHRYSPSSSNPHSQSSPYAQSPDAGQASQLHYIYQKISLHFIFETRFDEAGELWFKGKGDPRIFLRLFPSLGAMKLVQDERISIHKGLENFVFELRSVEELITMNLVQNYSPHIKPDVDTALSTIDLKAQLNLKARLMLLRYLRRWKRDRLLKGGASDSNHHIDSLVDTALAELFAERRYTDPDAYQELQTLLDRPNSCIKSAIENALTKHKCFKLLAEFYMKQNDLTNALDVWAKLHDQRFIDNDFQGGLDRMVTLLLNSNQPELVIKYALWMARLDNKLAVKLLVESKVSARLDVHDTFESLQAVDSEAAEIYLEHLVLRTSRKLTKDKKTAARDENATGLQTTLRTKLILGYLKRLKELLASSQEGPSLVMTLFRRLVEDYVSTVDCEPAQRPSFVEYLVDVTRDQAESEQPASLAAEAINTRVKLMVCLDQSSSAEPAYDAAKIKTVIEDMGGSAEVMALERAMVYAKLGLHRPALSLLAVTLKDVRSAETYCLRGGCLLSAAQANDLLAMAPSAGSKSRAPSSTDCPPAELLAILFDLLIGASDSPSQVALLLARHASHIPIHNTLSRLPDHWPLNPILAPYLTRALRRSCHVHHESTLTKSIALGHEISLEISLEERQAQLFRALNEQLPSEKVGGDVPSEGL